MIRALFLFLIPWCLYGAAFQSMGIRAGTTELFSNGSNQTTLNALCLDFGKRAPKASDKFQGPDVQIAAQNEPLLKIGERVMTLKKAISFGYIVISGVGSNSKLSFQKGLSFPKNQTAKLIVKSGGLAIGVVENPLEKQQWANRKRTQLQFIGTVQTQIGALGNESDWNSGIVQQWSWIHEYERNATGLHFSEWKAAYEKFKIKEPQIKAKLDQYIREGKLSPRQHKVILGRLAQTRFYLNGPLFWFTTAKLKVPVVPFFRNQEVEKKKGRRFFIQLSESTPRSNQIKAISMIRNLGSPLVLGVDLEKAIRNYRAATELSKSDFGIFRSRTLSRSISMPGTRSRKVFERKGIIFVSAEGSNLDNIKRELEGRLSNKVVLFFNCSHSDGEMWEFASELMRSSDSPRAVGFYNELISTEDVRKVISELPEQKPNEPYIDTFIKHLYRNKNLKEIFMRFSYAEDLALQSIV